MSVCGPTPCIKLSLIEPPTPRTTIAPFWYSSMRLSAIETVREGVVGVVDADSESGLDAIEGRLLDLRDLAALDHEP